MVEERSVPDDTEDVWFVTSQRTLDVARDFFGCPDLDGLPLMGDNQLGTGSRGSHWETRIMNDEFMAYGDGSMVSGMTIAMLEDLGMYLGDYSATACMSWGKKQGCGFVSSRCGQRAEFDAATAEVTLQPGEGCNKHWKSGTGKGWTMGNGEVVSDDLGGWNNGLRTPSGSCSSARANSIIERYCVATNCRRQWPGMVIADDDDSPPIALSSGKPLWSCSISSSNIEYEGNQYVCADGATDCKCSAECQTTNPADGTYWGPQPTDCTPELGPVTSASARGGLAGLLDNPLEDYPLIIAVAAMVLCMSFASCVWRCISKAEFSFLVGTSLLIFVIFIIMSVAVLAMTIYSYFFFEDLDDIVSQNAWMMLLGLSGGVLIFAIYGTVSVCLVAREKGCCKNCKCAIGVFNFLLFCLICVQTLGTVVAFFWIKDSYNFSEGQYSTAGQMEEGEASRTGIAFIDDSLDKAIREIEAATCNSYKKCCYTIAADMAPASNITTAAARIAGMTYLEKDAACDLISDEAGMCNPGLMGADNTPDPVLVCTSDDRNAAEYQAQCTAAGTDSACSAVAHEFNTALKVCEWDGVSCGSRDIGTCRAAAVSADSSFTCVGSHAGAGAGGAANVLKDPSNPGFCQLLSGSNRKGITTTGAVCYAMEEVGVLRGLRPDGDVSSLAIRQLLVISWGLCF